MVWGLGVNPQKLFFSGGEGSPFQNLERLYAFIYAIFFIFLNEMFMLFAMSFSPSLLRPPPPQKITMSHTKLSVIPPAGKGKEESILASSRGIALGVAPFHDYIEGDNNRMHRQLSS